MIRIKIRGEKNNSNLQEKISFKQFEGFAWRLLKISDSCVFTNQITRLFRSMTSKFDGTRKYNLRYDIIFVYSLNSLNNLLRYICSSFFLFLGSNSSQRQTTRLSCLIHKKWLSWFCLKAYWSNHGTIIRNGKLWFLVSFLGAVLAFRE